MVALAELLASPRSSVRARAQVVPDRASKTILSACASSLRSRSSSLPAGAAIAPTSRPPERVSTTPARGPDALLLRVPRNGGVARVTAYPQLDSTVWTSTDAAPALDRVLAFDPDAGLIAAARHARARRSGSTCASARSRFPARESCAASCRSTARTSTASALTAHVARFTPAGNWLFKPPQPARAVFPQTNGTALDSRRPRRDARVSGACVRRRRTVGDSVDRRRTSAAASARRSATASSSPVRRPTSSILRARTLQLGDADRARAPRARHCDVADPAIARTSCSDSTTSLAVVDPYQNSVVSQDELCRDVPRDLRVDPFGRYVLVRAATGDSVWVVSVGTDRVMKTVRSQWRGDLPFVAVDGAIVVDRRQRRRVPGRAGDARRRRRVGLLVSVHVERPAPARGVARLGRQSCASTATRSRRRRPPPRKRRTVAAPPAVDTTPKRVHGLVRRVARRAQARDEAAKISVNGQTARVVTG